MNNKETARTQSLNRAKPRVVELDIVAVRQLVEYADGAVGVLLGMTLADHVAQDHRRGIVALRCCLHCRTKEGCSVSIVLFTLLSLV